MRSVFSVVRVALVASLAMVMSPAYADVQAVDQLLQRLSMLDSMSGRFEQMVEDRDGTRLQQASGDMQVARGNRFYWHTDLPFEQLAVSDGERVWVYDVDLEQVVVRPLTRDLSSTPALLFGGDASEVANAFNVSQLDTFDDELTYRLVPTGDDPLFEQLDVTFVGDQPRFMRLVDALGQRTLIEFVDLEVNGVVDNARFDFTPPDGTDVIQQRHE